MCIKTLTKEFSLLPGEEYIFLPGEAHQFWNEGDDLLHYTGHVKPSHNYEYFIRQLYQSCNEANDDKPDPFDGQRFLLTRYKAEMDMLTIPRPVKKFVFPLLLVIGKLTGQKICRCSSSCEIIADWEMGNFRMCLCVRE